MLILNSENFIFLNDVFQEEENSDEEADDDDALSDWNLSKFFD